jgi:hypothetical protein
MRRTLVVSLFLLAAAFVAIVPSASALGCSTDLSDASCAAGCADAAPACGIVPASPVQIQTCFSPANALSAPVPGGACGGVGGGEPASIIWLDCNHVGGGVYSCWLYTDAGWTHFWM